MPEVKTNKPIEVDNETFDNLEDKDRALIKAIQELTRAIGRVALNG